MPTMNTQTDNDPGFYAAPEGTDNPRSLGYADAALSPRFLMRVTPGLVNLAKGEPVVFTIHVKAMVDFTEEHPLVLTLDPVVGRGSGNFAQPNPSIIAGNPAVTLTDGRISITAKSTDNAAKVMLETDYPPDWWGGSSLCTIHAGRNSVEASVVVADRVPAMWHPVEPAQ